MPSAPGEQSVARLGFGETPFDQPLTRRRDAEVDEDDDEQYGVGPAARPALASRLGQAGYRGRAASCQQPSPVCALPLDYDNGQPPH